MNDGQLTLQERRVLVVDDVTGLVRPLTEQDKQLETRYEGVSLDRLVDLVLLLCKHKNLPLVLVNQIVQYAGWSLVYEERTEREVRGEYLNYKYLSLTFQEDQDEDRVLTNEQLRLLQQWFKFQCVLLVADCESHDQGWASDAPELNGSYRGSWTWSELEIETRQESAPARVSDRVLVTSNFRASNQYRHHRRIFINPTLLTNIKFGEQVHLYLRAQYPGWCNHVKHARLAAYVSAQVNDDTEVDSAQVTQMHRSLVRNYYRRLMAANASSDGTRCTVQ